MLLKLHSGRDFKSKLWSYSDRIEVFQAQLYFVFMLAFLAV